MSDKTTQNSQNFETVENTEDATIIDDAVSNDEDIIANSNDAQQPNEHKIYTIGHFSIFEFDIIRDIKDFVKKFYKQMAAIAAIVVLLTLVWIGLININTSSMYITFKFANIGNGRNPDGSRFNIYEIVSDDVLDGVIKDLDNEFITRNYLKSHLVIQDIISQAKQSNVEQSILDGQENCAFLPNEFSISYSQLLGPVRAGRILTSLMMSYNPYFIDNHITKTKVLVPDFKNIEDYDYLNGAEYIEMQLNCMRDYMYNRQKENDKFSSDTTGKSFNDVVNLIDSMINVDLTTYRSYIIKSGLTRDKNSLFMQYYYSIKWQTNDYQLFQQDYDVSKEAVEIYNQNVTKVVFVPTLDESGDYYMSRTNIGIDYLVRQADTAKNNMQQAQQKIDEANYVIASYNMQNEPDATSVISADAMLSGMIKRINDLSKIAVKTEQDYLNTSLNCYPQFTISKFGIGLGANIKYILLGLISSIFLGAIAMYLVEKSRKYYRKYLKKRVEDLKNRFLKNKDKEVKD